MAQAKIPAPIDRPLSKAYLREFTGWSTEFPPGLSDPTSLRLMENVMINRDGSARVRPGLRYLSYDTFPSEGVLGVAIENDIVGTHEVFFLNDGVKAYLFAVRETNGSVGFRVLKLDETDTTVLSLTEAGFTAPQTEAVLAFTSNTKYVKYLQIDNKIFALSDAGEAMRLFYVGNDKIARKLTSVEKPQWNTADKLSVVHPDATWILGGTPLSTRKNLLKNPSFEGALVLKDCHTQAIVDTFASSAVTSGSKALRVRTEATRRNLAADPLTNIPTTPVTTWWKKGYGSSSIEASGSALRTNVPSGDKNRNSYLSNPGFAVTPGQVYSIAYDGVAKSSGVQNFRVAIDFYSSSGANIGSTLRQYGPDGVFGRHVWNPVTVPANAVRMLVQPYANINTTGSAWWSINNVTICLEGESTDVFSGDSGAGYFWEGTPYESPSIAHPAADAYAVVDDASVVAYTEYTMSASVRYTAVKNARVGIMWYTSTGGVMVGPTSAYTPLAADVYSRFSVTGTAPAGAVKAALYVQVEGVERGGTMFADGGLLENSATMGTWFDGSTVTASPVLTGWDGPPNASTSSQVTYGAAVEAPPAETPTADTLISSAAADNDFSVGFFYTFSNEIGESAPSQIAQVKVQRPWSQWLWVEPDASGNPSTTPTIDPTSSCDQLVAIMPEDVFDQALAQGATSWSLYALAWSDQEVVPTMAVKVASAEFSENPTYDLEGWAQVTSQSFALSEDSAPLPTANTRFNSTDPSKAGQGLVAADRMVLVYDPMDAAVIRWSSNMQGDYTNFSANQGGGYKTLTSGNLFIPACVKLWQNPQSVDTLTILCMGIDGYSTGYYMAPAQVAQQSEAVNIMGFEETTATPGTTSPYGCEVLNNALYHPLDEQLMKSTANNYNISHKAMTDQIQRMWSKLLDKDRIISAQLDNRLYFIVNNPDGQPLDQGQNGNEVWVLDTASENGSWSRWMVPAHSLRKIEYGGRVYMSLISKDGIFYFDPDLSMDDYVETDGTIRQRPISWLLETNTQGANRAHDAWCRLQQAQILVGNFRGTMEYGIRSWDVNGRPVEVSKVVRNLVEVDLDVELPFDFEDQLRIARDLKEWFFFARSLLNDAGEAAHCAGQVSAVQYRYTPVSVNVGYEYGSVETFEYQRATANWVERTTDNGVPTPFNDTRRP